MLVEYFCIQTLNVLISRKICEPLVFIGMLKKLNFKKILFIVASENLSPDPIVLNLERLELCF